MFVNSGGVPTDFSRIIVLIGSGTFEDWTGAREGEEDVELSPPR